MTRAATGDTVVLRPTNNVYTAMAAAAVVAQILGLVVLFVRMQSEFGTLI